MNATDTRSPAIHVGVLVLLWAASLAFAGVDGTGPVNDDWAYGLPVESLVEHGRLRLTFWQSMPLLPQILWGALFSLPMGFSFGALQASTAVLGLVAILATRRLLRVVGAGAVFATLGAASLLANPLFSSLSLSFMTDVPFLALATLSASFLVQGLDSDRPHPLVLGMLLALLATEVRQLGLALPLAFCAAAWLRWGWSRRLLLAAILPTIAIAMVLRWTEFALESSIGLPGLYHARSEQLGKAINDLIHLRLGVLRDALGHGIQLVLYLGLFLSPLVLAAALARGLDRARWVGGAVAASLATGALHALGMPLPWFNPGDVMTPMGAGPHTLPGPLPEAAGLKLSLGLTALATAGGLAIGWLAWPLGGRVWSIVQRRDLELIDPVAIFLGLIIAIGFVPVALAYGPFFDRYLLFLVPPALGLLALAAPSIGGAGRNFAILLTALGFLYSGASTHDYRSWNQARSEAVEFLRSQGVQDEAIQAGFEHDNYVDNRALLPTGRFQEHLADRNSAPYAVVFESDPGQRVLQSFAVDRWLAFGPATVIAVERDAATNDATP